MENNYEFWTAVGTVSAVVVALAIALVQASVALIAGRRRRAAERRKVASLVSAWIEHEYTPSQDGDYYKRNVTLHLANESDEPVFRIEVLCGVESEGGVIQLGPLAAPRIIPVLPPRREFTFDVTMGMLGFWDFAHDAFRGLVAEVSFNDHNGEFWTRNFAGNLVVNDTAGSGSYREIEDSHSMLQIGPTENGFNPMAVVLAFASAAGDDKMSDRQFRKLLLEHASGWKELTNDELAEVRELLSTSNLASHVWYPTPRIAYVRLISDEALKEISPVVSVITLVWRNRLGWTLFGIGPYLPWNIGFEKGELTEDPLDGREQS